MSVVNSTMCQRISRILSILLLVLSAHATHSNAPHVPRSLEPTVLRPININEYEIATGLHRRASEDFSDLSPQTQAELIYGSPAGVHTHMWNNRTLG